MAQKYSQTDCCVVTCTQSNLAAIAANKTRTTTEIAVACWSGVPLQRSVSHIHIWPPATSLQPLSEPFRAQLRDTKFFSETRQKKHRKVKYK